MACTQDPVPAREAAAVLVIETVVLFVSTTLEVTIPANENPPVPDNDWAFVEKVTPPPVNVPALVIPPLNT